MPPADSSREQWLRSTQIGKIPVNIELNGADPEEFDAVLLPGGVLNADTLRIEKKAQEFVRKMDEQGKPIAVICHGPWLLVSAGLVKGRKLTSWPTLQDEIFRWSSCAPMLLSTKG